MKPAEPVIEVSALTVERDAPILRGIEWRVERGQHWAILGANGSGKTSMLRALTGYLPPTSGTIRVLGETYGRSDWRELRTRVGIVSSSVHQMMPDGETALGAVASGKFAMIGYWGEMKPADRRSAMAILSRVEARALAERPWLYLSQGERQRVLIGRALMARPRLLILDEPCAGLDPVARERFLQFLARMARRPGAPVLVLVTHHVEEIIPVFSHVMVLKEGRVLASGPRARLLTARVLSAAFGAPVSIRKRGARYSLTVKSAPSLIL
jgi:iron complex transport system ATP-binding protein